ncbi:MAG: hypothetical protein H6723_02615 [Sandaracinus sp.]|nr:hypothetical protein [Sandaracinus sp.]
MSAVRGMVFVSGRAWMRERGLDARYEANLDASVRPRLHTLTALEWIPLDEALVAYAACDALGLDEHAQRSLGATVSAANNGVVLETIARLAGGFGVTPWAPLKSAHKVWLRSNQGGAVAVYRLDERHARIEVWQTPLCESAFFRTSLCGAMEHGLRLFRRSARVVEMSRALVPHGMAMDASW